MRFTGKMDDPDIGLVYFGYRYYAPALMRWISADPLVVHGVGGGMNPYAYVRGNPSNSVDPLGLFDIGSTPDEGDAPQFDGPVDEFEMVNGREPIE